MVDFREPERFWSKVDIGDPNKCWEWLAARRSNGYGQFGIHYQNWSAHRVAWILTFGPIPEGLCVCHKCDNHGCCNPYHLFLGTQEDNLADMDRKGRRARGEATNTSRLTEDDVRDIRKLYNTGKWTLEELGDEFRVGSSTVQRIMKRETWQHVPERR